ncbi:UNKNOWN [Stylonychia lemnae]|uniref:Uncharacterized protein n=1 Tax=Stylonychia lemnae TaxID=5949 RepID=A0A078B0X5_STYLE|nr:UNKNOWN [Stylonychia lemnae]|eukprot:CDW87002.1 UNKNOWN [Stylonychia lemnae]
MIQSSNCNVYYGLSDLIRGNALGLLQDSTALKAACYIRSNEVAQSILQLQEALDNPSIVDFARPFVLMNDIIVQTSDQLFACEYKRFTLQLQIRFTTIPGAFNLLADIILMLVLNEDIKNAFLGIFTAPNCINLGYNLGYFQSRFLNYRAQIDFSYDSLFNYMESPYAKYSNATYTL